jgi:hypothetical protein
LANSLIIGSLAISPASLWNSKWATLAMLGAGLVICAAWFLMTIQAWSAMQRHCNLAGLFAASCFGQLPNPFAEIICIREQTRLHRLILLVIGVFILLYLGLAYVRLVPSVAST